MREPVWASLTVVCAITAGALVALWAQFGVGVGLLVEAAGLAALSGAYAYRWRTGDIFRCWWPWTWGALVVTLLGSVLAVAAVL